MPQTDLKPIVSNHLIFKYVNNAQPQIISVIGDCSIHGRNLPSIGHQCRPLSNVKDFPQYYSLNIDVISHNIS